MNEIYTIDEGADEVRILHLTDHHLFEQPTEKLLGIPTQSSFQAVLNNIQSSPFHFDFIIDTGDLIQHNNAQAYHLFAQLIQPLKKAVFCTEGNHDQAVDFHQILANYPQIKSHRHILAGKHWQIILLDSHIEGKPAGELSQTQLDYLSHCLSQYPQRFALIALHHNLLPTHSNWLDQHSLRNLDTLSEILSHYPQVKVLLHGHIHQEIDALWQHKRILSTPSTCIQFRAGCDEFTLDLLPPGWREITLYPNGTIYTECKRLPNNLFQPDLCSKGY